MNFGPLEIMLMKFWNIFLIDSYIYYFSTRLQKIARMKSMKELT